VRAGKGGKVALPNLAGLINSGAFDSADRDVEDIRGALAGSPLEPGPLARDLAGWVTLSGVFVCSHCTGRIHRRGCRLPVGSAYVLTPVGLVSSVTVRECVGCGACVASCWVLA
jgi:succinate dehydrogenase/fumarate reductase-like Fe-S protein